MTMTQQEIMNTINTKGVFVALYNIINQWGMTGKDIAIQLAVYCAEEALTVVADDTTKQRKAIATARQFLTNKGIETAKKALAAIDSPAPYDTFAFKVAYIIIAEDVYAAAFDAIQSAQQARGWRLGVDMIEDKLRDLVSAQ